VARTEQPGSDKPRYARYGPIVTGLALADNDDDAAG